MCRTLARYLFCLTVVCRTASLHAEEFAVADSVTYPVNLHIVHTTEQYHVLEQQHPENKLVELKKLIPALHLDLRYAGTNNFMHSPVYPKGQAFLTTAAAVQLKDVEAALNRQGLGLIIYDAYRPYSITLKIFAIVKDSDYAASGKTGSKHNRGCAVDLGLVDLSTGNVLEMPTGFDSFSVTAHSDYMQVTPIALKNRAMLKAAMEKHGFAELKTEWWHFDFQNWKQFPLLDIPFDHI